MSFLTEIDAAASSSQAARLTWFDRLPADAQSELLEARRKWQAGGYTIARLTLAGLIVKAATERGWKTCDARRMAEWLNKS